MTTIKNIAAAMALFVISTSITNAQVVKANYPVTEEAPMAVKYLGDDGNYLSFQVTVEAIKTGNVFFEVADKTEGELYSSNLPRNLNVKTIKIEKRDGQVLNFKLVVGKNTYTKSFSVNTSQVETTNVVETDAAVL